MMDEHPSLKKKREKEIYRVAQEKMFSIQSQTMNCKRYGEITIAGNRSTRMFIFSLRKTFLGLTFSMQGEHLAKTTSDD